MIIIRSLLSNLFVFHIYIVLVQGFQINPKQQNLKQFRQIKSSYISVINPDWHISRRVLLSLSTSGSGIGNISDSDEKATELMTPSTRRTRSSTASTRKQEDDNVVTHHTNGENKVSKTMTEGSTSRRKPAKRNTNNARARRSNSLITHPASRRIKRSRSGNRASFPWKNVDDEDDDELKENTKRNSATKRQEKESDDADVDDDLEQPIFKKTRSRKRTFTIRQMAMKDMATIYELGNNIFTASEYPNMYRTWDDFAVVGNFANSAEFCFVAVGEPSTSIKQQKSYNDDDDNNFERSSRHSSENGDMERNDNSSNDEDNNGDDDRDEEIIGFLLGDSMTKSSIGTRGYIQWVAVESSYRRMGIATSLLEKFCEVADTESISRLLADTPADNAPAIRLFEKAGLQYKKDHVYLTKQLKEVETEHCDEDGYFDFHYSAKGNRVRIRPMEINDLYPIYAIGEKIFTSKSSNLFHFWDEQLVMHSYLSDPEYCVTATIKEDDGEETVVGFAFGTTIEKPRSSWRYGYLVWLGCHPDYQGLGLATQIYNVMVELFALEKVRMLMIDTQLDNVGALRFFRKIGFGHDEEHVYLSSTAMTETSIDLEVAAVAAENQAIAEAEAEAEADAEEQQFLIDEQEAEGYEE